MELIRDPGKNVDREVVGFANKIIGYNTKIFEILFATCKFQNLSFRVVLVQRILIRSFIGSRRESDLKHSTDFSRSYFFGRGPLLRINWSNDVGYNYIDTNK